MNNLHEEAGKLWRAEVLNMVKVKSYAPHVDHIVLDLRVQPVRVENAKKDAANAGDMC